MSPLWGWDYASMVAIDTDCAGDQWSKPYWQTPENSSGNHCNYEIDSWQMIWKTKILQYNNNQSACQLLQKANFLCTTLYVTFKLYLWAIPWDWSPGWKMKIWNIFGNICWTLTNLVSNERVWYCLSFEWSFINIEIIFLVIFFQKPDFWSKL